MNLKKSIFFFLGQEQDGHQSNCKLQVYYMSTKTNSAWLLFNMDYNVQKMHEKSNNVQNVQKLYRMYKNTESIVEYLMYIWYVPIIS